MSCDLRQVVNMEFVALTTRQLDYLARQDPYLEPIFKGVFASDQLPKVKTSEQDLPTLLM